MCAPFLSVSRQIFSADDRLLSFWRTPTNSYCFSNALTPYKLFGFSLSSENKKVKKKEKKQNKRTETVKKEKKK